MEWWRVWGAEWGGHEMKNDAITKMIVFWEVIGLAWRFGCLVVGDHRYMNL